MKKKYFLPFFIIFTTLLFSGCSTTDSVQKNQLEVVEFPGTSTTSTMASKIINDFIVGNTTCDGNGLYGDGSFSITELPMDEDDFEAYRVGDHVDLDNDGEAELILQGPYGGMFIDSNGESLKVFALGTDTTNVLSYLTIDGQSWIVYSDTMHTGREYHRLERYDGADNLAESITLDMEKNENGDKTYYFNNEEVSAEKFGEEYQKFFAES